MDVNWLEDFVALVEWEHFSRAAEARDVSQPNFSRRIRFLEDWVGTALFDRTTHEVKLTQAGQVFEPIVTETLRQLSQARTAAREAATQEVGVLTIAATHALSHTVLPDFLGVIGMNSKVGNIRLISDLTQTCEQMLRKAQVQLMLCHYHSAAPPGLEANAFNFIKLGHDSMVLAGAPESAPFIGGDIPTLNYATSSALGKIISAVFSANKLRLSHAPALSSHLAAVLRSMACSGRGTAWLPLSMIGNDLAEGRLKVIKTAIEPIPLEIRIYRSPERQSQVTEFVWSDLIARYA